MPYTHTTYLALRDSLAGRLGDPDKIFWTDNELKEHITEALRTFGLRSGFWRERGVLATTAAAAFYDLRTTLTNGAIYLLGSTVTDRDIIRQLQYALLETTSTQTSWAGTGMFTYSDLTGAVENRLNQFLADTGVVVTRSTAGVAAPPGGRQPLDESIIDVRRAAWVGASPLAYYVPLWREDERLLTAYSRNWSVDSSQPEAYSIMGPPPLQLQLAPVPILSGELELLTVDSVDLDPANTATTLGIPDDLSPGVKWGALADLLSKDGPARDLPRAAYAEQRYQEYVALGRLLPVVVHAEINGVSTIPSTLQELESSTPNWENITDAPTEVALAAPNLIALSPVPDTVYSITLDVVRRAPIPAADNSSVQLGREQLDMILDYAEHLALFKVHGAEWTATQLQAQNFLRQALTYNQRLSASARAILAAFTQSEREKQERPRRLESVSPSIAGGV